MRLLLRVLAFVNRELIFLIAIGSHVVMGFAVLIGGEPATWATGVATSMKIVAACGGGYAALGISYLAASGAVIWSMCRRKRDKWYVLALLPQQFWMMVSAFGAGQGMWYSHFADGEIRSREFIVSDQQLWFLVGLAHTIAVIAKVISHKGE